MPCRAHCLAELGVLFPIVPIAEVVGLHNFAIMKLSKSFLGNSIALLAASLFVGSASGQANGTVGNGPFPQDLNGSNFTYPYPVKVFTFRSQYQELDMAFMDVKPTGRTNKKTAVLLHGRNFCAATWEETIRVLSRKGYRVIAPDQVGFCKSSKPDRYQFTLHQLAWNTRALLNTLGIGNVTVIGHSMGGMLATRFSLQFPQTVDNLVLVNAIGLEDYLQKGVPYISIDQTLETEAASNYQSIRSYQQRVYYIGDWKPAYDVWVNMSVNIYHGSQRYNFIRNQAQVVDMILANPVAPYFEDVKSRTALIIGDKDKTAIGAPWSPPEVAAKLGRYDLLGPEVAARIPNSELLLFPGQGHSPQISDTANFHKTLLNWLAK
ncbi:alpha/beta hydrolase fold domain containing protein [Paramyrothecium foliicola]|nr:alpha/beta hydrolase fold domain containing protein [Paramyrothecium foliicola]